MWCGALYGAVQITYHIIPYHIHPGDLLEYTSQQVRSFRSPKSHTRSSSAGMLSQPQCSPASSPPLGAVGVAQATGKETVDG